MLPAALSVSNISHALTKPDVLREGDPSLDAVEACADWLMKEGEPRHDANTAWAFARLYCTRQKRARFAPLAPFVWLGLGGWRGRRWTAACYAEREEESQAKREHATALIRSLLNNSS